MTTLADLAADAYLAGWALTGAPYTKRVHAGLSAAVAVACEHRDDSAVLEATLHLGRLEGVWATVYDRRERLQRRHERAILVAWKACTAGLDPRDVVRRFRRDAYLTAEAATKDPQRKWWQELGITAALGWLRQVYHHDGYDDLIAALAGAIRSGMAEGEADALALAASRQGKTGFRIDRAFKAAYERLADDHAITRQAQDVAARLIDGAAGDTGRRLASLAGDGAGEDDMTSGVQDVTDARQAPSRWADWALWAGILTGAKQFYSWLSGTAGRDTPGPDAPSGTPPQPGPVLLDWYTAGDGRVCVTCQGYADNGPYTPEAVPGYPHSRCRCSVDLTADTRYTTLLGALLDSFSN